MEIGMKLINDPKQQQRVLKAMDAIQKGRTRLSHLSEQFLHAYQLPSQKDFKALGKKVSALRKEAMEIKRRLGEL